MLKKVVIALLAVAVGVAVLAFVSPKLFSLMMYGAGQVPAAIDEAIPPETELGRIKSELDQVEKEKPRLYHQIAVEEVAQKKLDAVIDANKKDLAELEKNVSDLAGLLEKDRDAVKVSYNGHKVARDEVVSQLKAAVEERDAKRTELEANQEQHDLNDRQIAEHHKDLDDWDAKVAQMHKRLTEVGSKIQKARAAQASAAGLPVDNDRLSRAAADLSKLEDRADVMQRENDLAKHSAKTLIPAPSEDDLLKRAHNTGDQEVGKGIAEKP